MLLNKHNYRQTVSAMLSLARQWRIKCIQNGWIQFKNDRNDFLVIHLVCYDEFSNIKRRKLTLDLLTKEALKKNNVPFMSSGTALECTSYRCQTLQWCCFSSLHVVKERKKKTELSKPLKTTCEETAVESRWCKALNSLDEAWNMQFSAAWGKQCPRPAGGSIRTDQRRKANSQSSYLSQCQT